VAHICQTSFELLEGTLAAADAAEQEEPQPTAPPVLLIVPENDLFAQVLQYHFTREGWSVVVVHDPEQAAPTLHGAAKRRIIGGCAAACLVILDLSLPKAQGLLDSIKLGAATNAVPTVALFPRGCDPERPECLRIQADIELAEPFGVAQLLTIARRQVTRASHEEPHSELQVQFILPSTREDLERVSELAAVLFRHSGLAANSQTRLINAFREAIGNAIQHGNQRDPQKTVRGLYRQDATQVTVVVRDEGDGFDYQRYLQQAKERDAVEAARERHQQGGQGGLGIFMIHRCADRVEYNDAGNVVTFTKFLGQTEKKSHAEPAERAGA
jgi:serine/threonine-protein kinase RsbW